MAFKLWCSRVTVAVFGYLALLYLVDGGVLPTTDTSKDDWKVIQLWPDATIPYNISFGNYDTTQAGQIISAMRRWEYVTCVKFVPWTSDMGKNTVNIFSGGSCYSRVGKEPYEPQLLGLAPACLTSMFTMVHEIGHTIGLVHEMERIDRDLYIDVIYDNINAASVGNFYTTDQKEMHYELHGTPYDYKSIMHYGPKFWSSNDGPTTVTLDPAYYHVIGKVTDVSFFDALYVNTAYQCAAKCPESLLGLCQHGGFLGGPDCRCICQDGYVGEFCEQTLPGYQHIVDWTCQKGWRYHEGQCFLVATDVTLQYEQALEMCTSNTATLVMFKDRPAMLWMNHLISEAKLITGVDRYWVGMQTEAATPDTGVKWTDGTIVDTNLLSVVSIVDQSERGCGVYDGETVTMETCDGQTDVGYICVKQHDADCGGRHIVTPTATSIQSPNFPDGYPPSTTCTYVLQTNEGSQIDIKFDEASTLDTACARDSVEMILTTDYTKSGTKYCGEDLQGLTLTSDGNVAILIFKSNANTEFAGFRATLTEVKSSTLTTTTSFLDSLRKAFDRPGTAEVEAEAARWSFKALWKVMNSMTLAKLF